MARLEVTQVGWDRWLRILFLESTDPQTVNWLLSEIKQTIPKFKIKELVELPSGPCRVYVEKIPWDYSLWTWVVKQLCLKGWEPFSGDNSTIWLRRLELD